MLNPALLSGFLEGYTRAMLAKRRIRATSVEYAGMRIDLTKWICSYCDSKNTFELNCRNCGAPESKGLRSFEGLPFRHTTFMYDPKIKPNEE